jgi:UDP-N-acetylmuramoyl-tripeptide--D-alanyl-D-alanine ligase
METFFTLLSLALSAVAFFQAYTHHLHMFQLNSYHFDVEMKWIFKNLPQCLLLFIPSALSLMAVIAFPRIYLLWGVLTCLFMGGLALYLGYKRATGKAKKPLVYTDRVKRMLVTSFLLFLVPAVLLYPVGGRASLCYALLTVAFMPLYVLLVNLINKPIESAVRRHYVNDAKRLLAENRNLKIIGITGSYGKTSVKYYLTELLSARYNVLMTPENFNTPMGVVRTVREHLSPLHEIFVCEMGAKRRGEIKELCDLVHPQNGVITAVGPQHLETFGSQERIRKTKFELARALPKEGKVYLNADSPELMKEEDKGNAVFYSLEGNGDYTAENVRTGEGGTTFTLVHGKDRVEFQTALIGRHNVLNIVGAIAIARDFGLSYEELQGAVRRLQCVPHRLQLLDNGRALIIDDAYNSNPSGAKAALETLSFFEGYRILVTPGMVELGAQMEARNKDFGKQAACCCDYAVLVGKRQAPPILEGLLEGGFPREKIFVAESFGEGIAHAYGLDTKGKRPVILLENDLPDNF